MSTKMSEVVRPIGAIENLFSAYAEGDAMAFALVADLLDPIADDQLARSLASVQAAHPMLRVCIGLDPDGHLALLQSGAPISVRQKRVERINLDQEVAQALADPFAPGVGPLMRVLAVSDGLVTSLICVWHHAVADGKAALIVLREVIAALGGEPPTEMADALPLDHFVGYTMPPLARAGFNPDPAGEIMVSIEHLHAEPTDRLLRVAKQHGVTFNSLLVAAVAAVHGPGTGGAAARLMAPIDIRPVVGAEIQDGLFISIAVTARGDGDDLWSHAARAKDEIAKARSLKAIVGFVAGVGDRFSSAGDYDAARRQLVTHSPFDTIVTNLGVIPQLHSARAPRCNRIFGPVLKPYRGQDIISVSSYAGRIALMHSSANGDTGLLSRLTALLGKLS